MMSGGGGSIINAVSIAGESASRPDAYAASKGAVIFADPLDSIELAANGARANALVPGLTNTDRVQVFIDT